MTKNVGTGNSIGGSNASGPTLFPPPYGLGDGLGRDFETVAAGLGSRCGSGISEGTDDKFTLPKRQLAGRVALGLLAHSHSPPRETVRDRSGGAPPRSGADSDRPHRAEQRTVPPPAATGSGNRRGVSRRDVSRPGISRRGISRRTAQGSSDLPGSSRVPARLGGPLG
ncbi:hypothetical protein [Streptomyces sp. Sce081]|uniref:hypothetical protein n=1 Tax=Streptomyces sp. Sce081 TaxID=3349853 RepID=UPI0035F275E6